ncbi:hypothetical protein [uncultured Massilia sp.]|uniref:hypothetical protein n=1 Tax=uncultured Massilia sp. TaxID=169973 RepID=UPI0025CE38B7|nr:hypothetical protein [uncultured Massilia sp.]
MMMAQPTTLRDAIANLSAMPDDATLFVERIGGAFLPSSPASAVVLSDEELELPLAAIAAARAGGKDYFLESFVIAELLEACVQRAHGDGPALDEFVARVIDYAEHDA